jgi:hypothetical protein
MWMWIDYMPAARATACFKLPPIRSFRYLQDVLHRDWQLAKKKKHSGKSRCVCWFCRLPLLCAGVASSQQLLLHLLHEALGFCLLLAVLLRTAGRWLLHNLPLFYCWFSFISAPIPTAEVAPPEHRGTSDSG